MSFENYAHQFHVTDHNSSFKSVGVEVGANAESGARSGAADEMDDGLTLTNGRPRQFRVMNE